MPHAIRPSCSGLNSEQENVRPLPSVTTTRLITAPAIRVAVAPNRVSEQGESGKKLHYAVVAQYPLTGAQLAGQYAHIVVEATVVAEGVEWQYPTIVGVVGLLCTRHS